MEVLCYVDRHETGVVVLVVNVCVSLFLAKPAVIRKVHDGKEVKH